MAKKKAVKTKSIEESLWESANKLRGSVESAEYKTRSIRVNILEVCRRQV